MVKNPLFSSRAVLLATELLRSIADASQGWCFQRCRDHGPRYDMNTLFFLGTNLLLLLKHFHGDHGGELSGKTRRGLGRSGGEATGNDVLGHSGGKVRPSLCICPVIPSYLDYCTPALLARRRDEGGQRQIPLDDTLRTKKTERLCRCTRVGGFRRGMVTKPRPKKRGAGGLPPGSEVPSSRHGSQLTSSLLSESSSSPLGATQVSIPG